MATYESQGIAFYTLDGLPFDVVDDLTFHDSVASQPFQKSLSGMTNIQAYEPNPATHETTLYAPASVFDLVSYLISMVNTGSIIVMGDKNNGTVTMRGAVIVEPPEYNPNKQTVRVSFQSPNRLIMT